MYRFKARPMSTRRLRSGWFACLGCCWLLLMRYVDGRSGRNYWLKVDKPSGGPSKICVASMYGPLFERGVEVRVGRMLAVKEES